MKKIKTMCLLLVCFGLSLPPVPLSAGTAVNEELRTTIIELYEKSTDPNNPLLNEKNPVPLTLNDLQSAGSSEELFALMKKLIIWLQSFEETQEPAAPKLDILRVMREGPVYIIGSKQPVKKKKHTMENSLLEYARKTIPYSADNPFWKKMDKFNLHKTSSEMIPPTIQLQLQSTLHPKIQSEWRDHSLLEYLKKADPVRYQQLLQSNADKPVNQVSASARNDIRKNIPEEIVRSWARSQNGTPEGIQSTTQQSQLTSPQGQTQSAQSQSFVVGFGWQDGYLDKVDPNDPNFVPHATENTVGAIFDWGAVPWSNGSPSNSSIVTITGAGATASTVVRITIPPGTEETIYQKFIGNFGAPLPQFVAEGGFFADDLFTYKPGVFSNANVTFRQAYTFNGSRELHRHSGAGEVSIGDPKNVVDAETLFSTQGDPRWYLEFRWFGRGTDVNNHTLIGGPSLNLVCNGKSIAQINVELSNAQAMIDDGFFGTSSPEPPVVFYSEELNHVILRSKINPIDLNFDGKIINMKDIAVFEEYYKRTDIQPWEWSPDYDGDGDCDDIDLQHLLQFWGWNW